MICCCFSELPTVWEKGNKIRRNNFYLCVCHLYPSFSFINAVATQTYWFGFMFRFTKGGWRQPVQTPALLISLVRPSEPAALTSSSSCSRALPWKQKSLYMSCKALYSDTIGSSLWEKRLWFSVDGPNFSSLRLTPCWLLSGPSQTPAHPGRWWMVRGTWPAETGPKEMYIHWLTHI